jgi:hypothetical protein
VQIKLRTVGAGTLPTYVGATSRFVSVNDGTACEEMEDAVAANNREGVFALVAGTNDPSPTSATSVPVTALANGQDWTFLFDAYGTKTTCRTLRTGGVEVENVLAGDNTHTTGTAGLHMRHLTADIRAIAIYGLGGAP